MPKAYPSNRVLTEVIKHNPRDGEVIICWEGQTYIGALSMIEVRRDIDSPATFTISGYIKESQ